jgi:hypothetical protein
MRLCSQCIEQIYKMKNKTKNIATCLHCDGTGTVTMPSEIETLEAYYFGCWDDSGHYWHTSNIKPYLPSRKIDERVPEGLRRGKIDSGFCPGVLRGEKYRNQPEEVGDARITHMDGWTVMAWWDRSIDHRPGSNSAIVAEGKWDLTCMMEIGNVQFSSIMKRQTSPIKLIEMIDENSPITKVTVNISTHQLEDLKFLAKERSTTITEVLQQAITTELYLARVLKGGVRILLEEKDKSRKELIFEQFNTCKEK